MFQYCNKYLFAGQDNENARSEVPFQLVIHYTDKKGAEAMRVISKSQPLTTDRSQAEQEMNMPLVSTHGAQRTGQWAAEGEYTNSRKGAMMYQRLLYRNV
jgi:hypothetical protein